MAFTRVQSAKGTTAATNAGSFTITLGSNATAGNFIVVAIGQKNGQSKLSVALSGQDAATPSYGFSPSFNSAATLLTSFHIIPVRTSATATLTITLASIANIAMCGIACEYSGSNPTADVFAENNSTATTSPVTGSITTVTNAELLVATLSNRATNAAEATAWLTSPTNSFSSVLQTSTSLNSANTDINLCYLERIVSSTGTYSTGGTTASSIYTSNIIGFNEVSSSAVQTAYPILG